MKKLKKIIFIESLVILILLFVVIKDHGYFGKQDGASLYPLISPRIAAGILPAESLLIFNFKPLREDIAQYLDEHDLNVSLYVLNVRDGASFGINSSNRYEAVSLNKLPVAIITMEKIEKGDFTLSTLLRIEDEDRDEASGTLYLRSEKELSVQELLRYMLEESDNTAFNVLAKQISVEDGKSLTEYLDYYQNDINYSEPQGSLQISPKNGANAFVSLYLSTILTPAHSNLILSYLTNTTYDIKKYADLPKDVTIAHKYGSFYYQQNEFFHDCGIIYIEDARIAYCVMTQGMEKEKAEETLGTIIKKIYNFVIQEKRKKDIGIE